jgi:subtilase family serine protease
MSRSNLVRVPRPRELRSRIRRERRISPGCERLEIRQVLSTGTVASSLSAITAQSFLQVQPMAGSGTSALSPQQIASAYGINGITFSGVSGTGAGQTIAIVDAYGDPNMKTDLAAFDAKFGLTAPPTLTVDNLGVTTPDAGWALETALDVEWAHAVAPQANIVVVEAPSASLGSLLSAVRSAASLPNVGVVSMSWGSSEFYGESNLEGVFSAPAGHTNETFIAASGDSGAWSGPSFPAISPNVLGVGGTTLATGSNNSYGSETGWTDSTGGFSGYDNGFQVGLSAPSYQVAAQDAAGLNDGLRTSPDVSFNADPNTGYAVYDSVPYNESSGWYDVGGTSAAAPAWAGLVAITDQGLTAAGKSTLTTTQLATELYSLPSSDFHDITAGSNGDSAGTGYDLVTGLGSPKANLLVPGLLTAAGVKTTPPVKSTAPTSQTAATAAVVHNAAITSASSTPSAVVPTAIATPNFAPGLSALPVQTPTTSSTAGSSGFAGAGSAGSGVSVSGNPIGLGQATSPSMVLVGSSASDTAEASRSAIDVIDPIRRGDAAEKNSPTPQAPAKEPTMPRSNNPDEVIPPPLPEPAPQQEPVRPSDRPAEPMPGAVDAVIARLVEGAPEAGALPGLIAGGAIVVLGQRVVIERDRRRSWSRPTRSRGR